MATEFESRVYSVCRKIPKGKVATYKAIAAALGCKGYRAVGNALNKNPFKTVPCHRVVRSDGKIGGFARGSREKIKLLRKEGIKITDNKISKKYLFSFL